MMRALMAVDDDERYPDVVRAAEWCLGLGPEGEVVVCHAVVPLRFMPFRGDGDPGWAGTERAIFERVDEFLAETARRLEARGLRARPLRLEGDAAEALVQASSDENVDVLVLGALGQSRSQDFLVGSVAEKVQALSRRDVLLVRPAREEAASRFRALLAVDGSPVGAEVIDAFAAKIRSERAEIQVVHVLEAPVVSFDVALASEEAGASSVPPRMRERADEAIRGALSTLERHGLHAFTSIRRGRAASEILQEAESFGADLLVLGSHGEGRGVSRHLLAGTVAKRVARHAPCSVLVVAASQESR